MGPQPLLHSRHHLYFQSVFHQDRDRRSGSRPGDLGLCHGDCRRDPGRVRAGPGCHRRCRGARKPWLFGCTYLAVPAMASLWFARPGMGDAAWPVVACLIVATVLFEYSVIIHNSMLPSLASRGRVGGLSGLGLALGNASGVLLLLFVLFAWIWPEHPAFGLDPETYEPERAIGALTGLWFGLFAL